MNRNKNILTVLSILCAGLLILLIQGPLFAQLPPPTTAAEEEKAVLEEKPFKEFEEKPEVEIEREDEEIALPPAEAEKKFFIRKINIIGNTVLPPKLIDKIAQEYENREVSLVDLMELADRITSLYASNGYVTSQAYVPPQRIEDNTVTIEILEGEYGDFDIEGTRYTRKNVVQRRLKKKPGAVFNYNQLRKDLLYLNENPDRIVRGALVRGKRPKTTDLKVTVKDRPPIHLGYEISNTGNKSTGHWRHTCKLKDTGLFLYDDLFLVRYIYSDNRNLWGIAANYVLPVNEFGTKLGASLSHFRVKTGHDYEDLDVKSRSTTYSFYVQHPIFDFDYLKGKMDVGLDVKEARVEARPGWDQEVTRASRDRLRVMKTGITLEESDKWGRSVIRNEVSWAPRNFLGSCDNISHIDDTSREEADGTFVKYNYKISRLNRLPFSATLLLSLEGQAANNLLYSSEQHRIGGANTVRGYAEGEALGDYGANASAEIRFPFYFIPRDFYVYAVNPRQAVQGVGFMDWGFAHMKTPTTADRHNEDLIGTGFGLRLNFMNCISGRFDMAWPAGNRSSYGREPRLHILFTMEEPTLQQYEAILEEMLQYRIRRTLNSIAKDVPLEMIESYEKALALEKEGRYEEARALYVSVINKRNGVITEAKAMIGEAIKKEEDTKAYFTEAEEFYKKRNYLRARELYEKILLLKDEE